MTVRLPNTFSVETGSTLPKPGDVVADKFRIDRLIGRGGMGAVFAVTHVVTHKRLAIKWLLTGLGNEDQVKRFVRESQVAGRVEHPNLVEVHDIYRESSSMFMVMELLKGEALSAHLARMGQLAVRDACTILLACMDGIAAAHRAGVVHRDIKPANIFLHEGHGVIVPKVLDFGISRLSPGPDDLTASTTRSGVLLGTPLYMAPEQLRCESSDERVDVYALGVTLYELLAGRRPYEGSSYAELVLKVVSGEAPPLAAIRAAVPPELSAAVARAMAPLPAQRFASVDAFAQAIRPFGEAGVTGAVGASRPARAARRSWPQAALLASLLSALLIALGLLWHATRSAPHTDAHNTPPPPDVPSAPAAQTAQASEEPSADKTAARAADSEREAQPAPAGKPEGTSPNEPRTARTTKSKSSAVRRRLEPTAKPADNKPPTQESAPAPRSRQPAPVAPDLTLSPDNF